MPINTSTFSQKNASALIVAVIATAVLIGLQFRPVIKNDSISSGLGTETFTENFGWPLSIAVRSVDRSFDPEDFIDVEKGATQYHVLNDSIRLNASSTAINLGTIIGIAALIYLSVCCAISLTSDIFVNFALLLVLMPLITFPLLNFDASHHFIPSSADEFAGLQLWQLESAIISLTLIAFVLFHWRPKHTLFFSSLVLFGHAFLGYVLIYIRGLGGLRW